MRRRGKGRACAARAGAWLAIAWVAACGGGGDPAQPSIDASGVAGTLCTQPPMGGWCWQRPRPQGQPIAAISFADDRHGMAVAARGSAFATEDAGVTWRAVPAPTQLDLSAVVSVDANVAWAAAGDGSEILRTVDGGTTWTAASYGGSNGVATLAATGAHTAWVMSGVTGEAWITRDDAAHWTRVVAFGADSIAVSRDGTAFWSVPIAGGPLQRSLDDGATWTTVATPEASAGFTRFFQRFEAADGSAGLLISEEGGVDADGGVFGRTVAWHTKDAGASWQRVADVPQVDPFGTPEMRLVDARTLVGITLWTAFVSTDAGATWTTQPLPPMQSVQSWRADAPRRLLVRDGAARRDWFTADGGATWRDLAVQLVGGAGVSALWFFDRRTGMAASTDGVVARTSDGGATWIASAADPVLAPLRSLQFLPDGRSGRAISAAGALLVSADGGLTWTVRPDAGASLLRASFADAGHGYAVGIRSANGVAVFATRDAGLTWTDVAESTGSVFADVAGHASGAAVAVGPPGQVLVTADGGATWAPRPTGTTEGLQAVAFADARTVVAVGSAGVIVRSRDGGRTWSTVQSPTAETLMAVRFASAMLGHAVGSRGVVLVTEDGGATWEALSTRVAIDLTQVHFVDEHVGWIGGSNGAILATITSGR